MNQWFQEEFGLSHSVSKRAVAATSALFNNRLSPNPTSSEDQKGKKPLLESPIRVSRLARRLFGRNVFVPRAASAHGGGSGVTRSHM